LDDGLSVFSAGSFHQGLQQFAPWHDPIVSDWLATTIISYSSPVLLSYTAITISMLQAIGIVQHIVSMSHQSSVQKIRSIENVFAQRSKLDCKSSQHTVSQRYILSQSNTAMLTGFKLGHGNALVGNVGEGMVRDLTTHFEEVEIIKEPKVDTCAGRAG